MTSRRADKTYARFWMNLFAVAGLIATVLHRVRVSAGLPNSALNRFSLVAVLMTALSLIGWRHDPRSGQSTKP